MRVPLFLKLPSDLPQQSQQIQNTQRWDSTIERCDFKRSAQRQKNERERAKEASEREW